MATHGPVNGRHVSYIHWFKIMMLAGVNPATSGQGGETWEEPPTGVPLFFLVIYMEKYLYMFAYVYSWGATGLGLSPSPWSHIALTYDPLLYHLVRARGCVLIWFQWLYKRPTTCPLTIGLWNGGLCLHLRAVIWVIRPCP
jgi:hypothetical protein